MKSRFSNAAAYMVQVKHPNVIVPTDNAAVSASSGRVKSSRPIELSLAAVCTSIQPLNDYPLRNFKVVLCYEQTISWKVDRARVLVQIRQGSSHRTSVLFGDSGDTSFNVIIVVESQEIDGKGVV